MVDRDIKEWLSRRFGKSVSYDEPMAPHTSLGVGGPAEVYVTPQTLEALRAIVRLSQENHLPFLVIGNGSNLLVGDGGIGGLVISLDHCLQGISLLNRGDDGVSTIVLAGTGLQTFCRYAIDHGLEGIGFALGIPGTVGGGIRMNAGTANGQLGSVVEKLTVLFPSGDVAEIEKENLKFGYRTLSFGFGDTAPGMGAPIILSGCFALRPGDPVILRRDAKAALRHRKATQPLDYPSAGCFFRNPSFGKPAGELIELAGLKGKRIGGAEVSAKHANFLINLGGASSGDFLDLMEMVQDTVSTAFGIDLEAEVTIVGT